jgi:hypothetical protein
MLGDPAGAHGTKIDPALRGRMPKHTTNEVRAESSERSDDESTCH